MPRASREIIEQLREQRRAQAEREEARDAEFRHAQWQRRTRRRLARSPEVVRSGRAADVHLSQCSSRSRSPRRCVALALLETEGICAVSWDHYAGIHPDASEVLEKAESALADSALVL